MNSESGNGASLLDARDSAELLRCFYEQARDAMIVFDPIDLRVIDANRSAKSIGEWLPGQPLGSRLTELFDHDSELVELLDACRSGRPPRSDEPVTLKASAVRGSAPGDQVMVRWRVDHFNVSGVLRGVLIMAVFGREIFESGEADRIDAEGDRDRGVSGEGSASKIAAAHAAKSRSAVNDRAISVAPLGIVIADATVPDLPIVFCNRAFERMTGYSAVEIVGRNCRFLQREDHHQPGVAMLRQAVAQQRDCTAVVRNYRKDGQMFWCEVSVSPVRDSDGRVTHFIGIQSDITRRVALNERLKKSQRVLQNAQLRACLGSWEYSPESGDTVWSKEMFRLYHRDPRQGIPQTVEEFVLLVHPDDRQAVIDRNRRIQESDQPVANLDLRTNPDLGPVRWLDSSAARVTDDSERGFHVAGTVLDVTDRKLAEMALRVSEHRFRTLCEHSAMGIFLADVDGSCTYVNESGCAIVGQTQQESSGNGWANALHPDDRPRMLEKWRRFIRGGGVLDSECRFVHTDGTVVWSRVRSSDHRSDEGELVGYVGSFVDITSQKVAQEKLQQSERRYRALVQHAPEAIVVLDPQTGRFVDFNKNALKLFACDAATLRRGGPRDFSPERQPNGRNSVEMANAYVESAIAGEHPVFEWWHRDMSGREVPCEIRLLRLDLDSRVLVRGSITDISERKAAEQQFRMTRFAVESTDDAMFVVDRDARFVDVNSVACSRLGYSRRELIGMTVSDINPEYPLTSWPDHWQQIKQAGRLVYESTHTRSDGTSFPVEISKSFFEFDGNEYAFAFVRDITERKRTEERLRERETQLAHVSRLSTMGEMVAGIAHELNQPLYSIINYSKATGNVIKSPTPENLTQIEAWNDQIGKAATRAGQIIRRLRGFVQRESTYLATDLHEIIRDALELVRHASERAGITLKVDRKSADAEVRVDRVQIQQVLVNLLVNAIEAIQQQDCRIREIVVTTSRVDDQIQVTVADTGPGISWEDDRSMFAAFETTKKDGMGMGLAISNTIIETFGGRLSSSGNDRGGATFYFTLPAENSGGRDDS